MRRSSALWEPSGISPATAWIVRPFSIYADRGWHAVPLCPDVHRPKHALMPKVDKGHQGTRVSRPTEVEHGGIESCTCFSRFGCKATDLPAVLRMRIGCRLSEGREDVAAEIWAITWEGAEATDDVLLVPQGEMDRVRSVELILFPLSDNVQRPAQLVHKDALSKPLHVATRGEVVSRPENAALQ